MTQDTKKIIATVATIMAAAAPSIVSFLEAREAKRAARDHAAATEQTGKIEAARSEVWMREQWEQRVKSEAELAGKLAVVTARVDAIEAARSAWMRSRLDAIRGDTRLTGAPFQLETPTIEETASRAFMEKQSLPKKPEKNEQRVLDTAALAR